MGRQCAATRAGWRPALRRVARLLDLPLADVRSTVEMHLGGLADGKLALPFLLKAGPPDEGLTYADYVRIENLVSAVLAEADLDLDDDRPEDRQDLALLRHAVFVAALLIWLTHLADARPSLSWVEATDDERAATLHVDAMDAAPCAPPLRLGLRA